MGGYAVRAAGRTDVGRRRENNEDAYLIGDQVVAVADGVGGAAGGEIASSQVVAALGAMATVSDVDEAIAALTAALEAASRSIAALVDSAPDLEGMGTTATALVWAGPSIVVAQVGDSRAYYLGRQGSRRLVQITRDDSLVQLLLDRGDIRPDQAQHHPRRNVILQAVNGSAVQPAFQILTPLVGDRFLLCSDGLSDYVPHDVIETILKRMPEASAAADELIAVTLAAQAPDNVTVIVVDIVAAVGAVGAVGERVAADQLKPGGVR